MTNEFIDLTIGDDGVGRITMVRQKQANTVNLPFAQALKSAAETCRDDPRVRAVIFAADEGPIFSAGGDLRAFESFGDQLAENLRMIAPNFHGALMTLATMDPPVITAVDGMAAGAGFSMVLASSLVVATPRAKFTMAYTAAGLTPDGTATFFLPRIVGLRKAEELILLNQRLTAEEALELGVINQIVDEAALMPTVEELATRIANGPTKAFGASRRLMLTSFDTPFEPQIAAEIDAIVEMATTEDGKEGIGSFLEKRTPKFVGR